MRLGVIACALATISTAALAQKVERTDTCITVAPAQGSVIRLQVYGGGIIRVTKAPTVKPDLAPSLMVTAKPVGAFTVNSGPAVVTLGTPKSASEVDFRTGQVRF